MPSGTGDAECWYDGVQYASCCLPEEGQAARGMTIMLSKGPRRSKQWSAACLCNLAQSRYARTALVEANVVKTA